MEKKKFINSHQQTKINHKGIFMANSFHVHDVQLSTVLFLFIFFVYNKTSKKCMCTV